MIIGEPEVFAIESQISKAYAELGLRALGLFVSHVGGNRYGVYESDATMIANSFDEVGRRLKDCGLHVAPFACEPGKDLSTVDQEYSALMLGNVSYVVAQHFTFEPI